MNNVVLGLGLIVCGLGLVAGGIVVLTKQAAEPSPVIESPRTALIDARQPAFLAFEEKGRKFEEWVVKKFDRRFFKLIEWRGDKIVNGIHAQTSEFPDLEIEFTLKGQRAIFAVECKWRQSFDRGAKPGIEWATERQIRNYQQFQRERDIPVFVTIGIGGEPDNPAELYLVDLKNLKYPHASADYLARFRRMNLGGNFYFDSERLDLK